MSGTAFPIKKLNFFVSYLTQAEWQQGINTCAGTSNKLKVFLKE